MAGLKPSPSERVRGTSYGSRKSHVNPHPSALHMSRAWSVLGAAEAWVGEGVGEVGEEVGGEVGEADGEGAALH